MTVDMEYHRPGNGKLPGNAEFMLISTRCKAMTNKEILSSSLPVIQDVPQGKARESEDGIRAGWPKVLKKVWLYLKGENKEKSRLPDPAAAIILKIEDKVVAGIVRDLHYRTPKSLKAMRKACEQCFILPDDCPYYDYSIFDVKKATRKLEDHPKPTHKQVVEELRKINKELAHHLSEYLD